MVFAKILLNSYKYSMETKFERDYSRKKQFFTNHYQFLRKNNKMEISIELINAVGVGMILLAFFLLTFKIIDQESILYLLLNIFGAGIAGYGAYLLESKSFVVLEFTWVLVSTISLVKVLRKK